MLVAGLSELQIISRVGFIAEMAELECEEGGGEIKTLTLRTAGEKSRDSRNRSQGAPGALIRLTGMDPPAEGSRACFGGTSEVPAGAARQGRTGGTSAPFNPGGPRVPEPRTSAPRLRPDARFQATPERGPSEGAGTGVLPKSTSSSSFCSSSAGWAASTSCVTAIMALS